MSPQFIPLRTPLTSVAWDGDAYSTTAKTLIDLSAVFGAPANVKAVLVRAFIRDIASAANDTWLMLSPNNVNVSGLVVRCSGLVNDSWADACLVVPCDANGDTYYQISASGAGTMDIWIEIWGYWL